MPVMASVSPLVRSLRAPLVDWLLAGAIAAVLLWLSNWLVPPATLPFPGHGERFAAMVADPFAVFRADASGAPSPFPHRILWPLLAHVAGWFGVSAVGATALTSWALLAVVAWFVRQRANWLDALLVTTAIAITGAVQVYKPMACMSADTLDLLLLLLAVHHVRRPFVCWSLVAVATFSHELAIFFAPWLVVVRVHAGGKLPREIVAVAACGALHFAWRTGIGFLVRSAYGAGYYTENAFWVPWGMPSMEALLALVTLAEFGALLVVPVWALRVGAFAGGRWAPWLLLAGIAALTVFAYDVMRFASFFALPIVLGAVPMLAARGGRLVFAALVVMAGVLYQHEHPVPSQQGGASFTEVSGDVMRLLVVSPEAMARITNKQALTAEQGLGHLPALLGERPSLWLGCAGTLALVVVAGIVLARFVRPAAGYGRPPYETA